MFHFKMPRSQAGLTLIELFLALAVIAIIWVMATRYYQMVYHGTQVNDAIGMIQAVRGASAQYAAGKAGYSGISMAELNANGLLPKDLVSSAGAGVGTNPWGGNISVTASGTGNAYVTIELTNLPATACENLANKFKEQAESSVCNSSKLDVTFS